MLKDFIKVLIRFSKGEYKYVKNCRRSFAKYYNNKLSKIWNDVNFSLKIKSKIVFAIKFDELREKA